MSEFFITRNVTPVRPLTPTDQGQSKTKETISTGPSFQQVLQNRLQEQPIKFSAHALKRLENRGIALSSDQMNKLQDAVNRVDAKGARESLVLMDDVAMVVSVKNRTVITAVDREGLKDNIFTNIDSAVII
ncbi:MAG: TIGR02530 family flagellar biosynthesis protein [Methylocystaceae bacterium]